MKKWE